MTIEEGAYCPVPITHSERIMLGHGSGGLLSHNLITRVFQRYLSSDALKAGDDAASLATRLNAGARLAISTDSHVVTPLFFPGGDIGRLAICGTVNDLSMVGAEPAFLTAGFILEEGLEVEILERILASMQASAAEANVQVVAGDTKVVQRGKADGIYINTAGVGFIPAGRTIGGAQARAQDAILVSGPLGDHGIAVLAARGELGFETGVRSDVAPLNHLIAALLAACPMTHVLRDPTRGGLGTTLNEIARQSNVCLEIDEDTIPVRPAVAAACEMLGFDPLYIANEGKLVAIVPGDQVDIALTALRSVPYGQEAVCIGRVLADPPGRVLLRTRLGSRRVIDMLAGELLPRIC
jgi:hydrogenase expression/formation protein HypE